jgi:hypothetical protein
VAKDFKAFIRHFQTSHVFCSPHYPQSNGKIERFHRTLKEQAIRPKTPLNLEDAKRIAGTFIDHYNQVRLHSALGYVAPADRLAHRHRAIFQQRDQKLENARQPRKLKRQQLAAAVVSLTAPVRSFPLNQNRTRRMALAGRMPARAGKRRALAPERASALARVAVIWAGLFILELPGGVGFGADDF